MDNKIFISHCEKDRDIVTGFIEVLIAGTRITKDDIYCTSINGPQIGDDFINSIKENITSCKLVMLLITENYVNSMFCLAEMGAAWALSQKMYPIIVPPLTKECLNKTPIRNMQAKLLNKENMIELYDELDSSIVGKKDTRGFISRLDQFIQVLNSMSDRKVVEKIKSNKSLNIIHGDSKQKEIFNNCNIEKERITNKTLTDLFKQKLIEKTDTLIANYKNNIYEASLVEIDKKINIKFDGKIFKSPSSAATYITGKNMNGWIFWSVINKDNTRNKVLFDLRKSLEQ